MTILHESRAYASTLASVKHMHLCQLLVLHVKCMHNRYGISLFCVQMDRVQSSMSSEFLQHHTPSSFRWISSCTSSLVVDHCERITWRSSCCTHRPKLRAIRFSQMRQLCWLIAGSLNSLNRNASTTSVTNCTDASIQMHLQYTAQRLTLQSKTCCKLSHSPAESLASATAKPCKTVLSVCHQVMR